MAHLRRVLAAAAVFGSGALAAAVGCSNGNNGSEFDDGGGSGTTAGNTSGTSAGNTSGTTVGSTGDNTGGLSGGDGGCSGLECKQVTCTNGGTTKVTGTVYDPAGKVALYNVLVYVPNGPVQALTQGASCDKCAGTVSGKPLVSAITDANGQFVLQNVPVGENIPLVIQVGKWRRQITLPKVESCQDNVIAEGTPATRLLRLPRKGSEGDMPYIALTTGGADPLECLLRKIGVDDSEFTTKAGGGHVQLFSGSGYNTTIADGGTAYKAPTTKFAGDAAASANAAFSPATELWSSVDALKAYDVVLFACEGAAEENLPDGGNKEAAALTALKAYADLGGRVFASHYHEYWFRAGPTPFPAVGEWAQLLPPPPNPVYATVDTSFPKGEAFKQWLGRNDALTDAGLLPLKESRHTVNKAGTGARSWITAKNTTADAAAPPTTVQYMTFNTPLEVSADNQCGRVVFSDLHVSSGDVVGTAFPGGCITTDLSPQEKALEFMLFDLSACVQNDADQPAPPK